MAKSTGAGVRCPHLTPGSSVMLSEVCSMLPWFPCPSSLFAVILTPPPPGHLDADLLRLGAHSLTFIQRERGFVATGLTRVLLVASLESRQRLFLMVWRVSSRDPESWGRPGSLPWLPDPGGWAGTWKQNSWWEVWGQTMVNRGAVEG